MKMCQKIRKTFGVLMALVMVLQYCMMPAAASEEHMCSDECIDCLVAEENTPQETLPDEPKGPERVERNVVDTVQVILDTDLPGNEELFFYYVEQELYGYDMSFFGTAGRTRLNAAEQEIYDILKSKIEKVASGGGTTEFVISGTKNLKTEWTAADIQELNISDPSQVEEEFLKQFNLDKILKALLDDCPFDLYWFDKTKKGETKMQYGMSYSGWDYGTYVVYESIAVDYLSITFAVANDYRAATNVVTSNVSRTSTAKTNAEKVVLDNTGKTDYEKLLAYKEYICKAVSYNEAAADKNYTGGYGDPWQLIAVFDADSSTNVVCEGYAKALQYLCELGGIDCICASGTMVSGNESGPHMWNVVTLDGKNYLVDVTNCDEGTIGEPDLLFLEGGTYANGCYTINGVTYICEDLNLSPEKYSLPAEETCSHETTVTVDNKDGKTHRIVCTECGVNVTSTAEMHIYNESTGECICGAKKIILGDVDLDNDVDAQDLTIMARHVGRIEMLEDATAVANGDVNSDGAIDANDLTKHARYVGRIISSWDQN